MRHIVYLSTCIFALAQAVICEEEMHRSQYQQNPFIIKLDVPPVQTNAGGIIVADLNRDSLHDYVITMPGVIAAYLHNGEKLWVLKTDIRVSERSEKNGLPGNHGAGVQVADIDNDRDMELLYLSQDNFLHVLDAKTGKEEWNVSIPVPHEAKQWEHLVVADFHGKGDRDLLLQASNSDGYRFGRFLVAYRIDDLQKSNDQYLWQRDDFIACAHSGARVADLDLDGKDEVLGGNIIGANGDILMQLPLEGHIDAIMVADVLDGVHGLEVVALEEGGGNHVFLYNKEGLIWKKHNLHQEAQNAIIGEFDQNLPGLEIWCRSRLNKHQFPFVFGATGVFVRGYSIDQYLPEQWTIKGVEEIWAIDWSGGPQQLAVAKARHEAGDIGVFDPITGKFLYHRREKADRLYVADVSGDWREEIIVLSGNILRIYHNEDENPNPDRKRLWERKDYKRSKMTWNYYNT